MLNARIFLTNILAVAAVVVLIVALGNILAMGSARAQAPTRITFEGLCFQDRESAVGAVAAVNGALPSGGGVSPGGTLMEVLTSPTDGTWVLMVSDANKTCLIGRGEAWFYAEPEKLGPSY